MSDWRFQARCAEPQYDSELWFPVGTTGPAEEQIEDAKAECRRCDVIEECLRYALDNGLEHGVWGGLSEDERRALKRRGQRAERRATGQVPVPRDLVDATPAREALVRVTQTGASLGDVSRLAGADGHHAPTASLSDIAKGRRARIDRARSAAVLAACKAILTVHTHQQRTQRQEVPA